MVLTDSLSPSSPRAEENKPTIIKIKDSQSDDDEFRSHLNLQEALELKKGDQFDHRDKFGRVFPAEVANKDHIRGVEVHYEGWPNKWNIWSDPRRELWRFAAYKSISKRPRHRFKDLGVGDFIDCNPMYSDFPGWRYAEIKQLDNNSGQVQVILQESGNGPQFGGNNGNANDGKEKVHWVHLDNPLEVAVFATKANGNSVMQQQSNIMNDIVNSSSKKIEDTKFEPIDYSSSTNNNNNNNDTREGFFKCGECPKSFTQRNQLQTHKLTHIKRDFKCNVCGKSFAKKAFLKIHVCFILYFIFYILFMLILLCLSLR